MNGTIILQGVVGSTAYGLNHELSDEDRLGVFVAPMNGVLGLHGDRAADTSIVSHDPDLTLHEVGKFLRLCLKGNPTVMEVLWLTKWDTCTSEGDMLVEWRRSLLSTKAVRGAYVNYAVKQALRLTARTDEGKTGFTADLGKRTAKHGRDCFRLMLQAEQLLSTGELTVNVSDRRDHLCEMGELAVSHPTRFVASFETARVRLEAVRSVLPDSPDISRVETVLVGIRRSLDEERSYS